MAGTYGMNSFVYYLNSVNNPFTSGSMSNYYYSFSIYMQTIHTYKSGGKKVKKKWKVNIFCIHNSSQSPKFKVLISQPFMNVSRANHWTGTRIG